MSSFPSSNPPEPVGRKLYELLEQPQEPFLMEVYLLENGCLGKITWSQSSPLCWPLRKFGSHVGIRKSRAAGFLRRVLVKLVYSKTVRKALHLDRKTTANQRSSIFNFFLVESKYQLSHPMSVLELRHPDESSPFGKQNSELFEESMNELIDVACLTQIVLSESSRFRDKLNQYKPESREIGLCLEAAILDDLKEEAILDMMNHRFSLG